MNARSIVLSFIVECFGRLYRDTGFQPVIVVLKLPQREVFRL